MCPSPTGPCGQGMEPNRLEIRRPLTPLSPDELWVPPCLRNREWMFMPWGDRPTDRHRSFSDKQSLHTYLAQRFPPLLLPLDGVLRRPIPENYGRQGLEGGRPDIRLGRRPPTRDQLHRLLSALMHSIQEQAWSPWNDYLEPEFGFKREYAQFTFSGHRGFHIHLRDPSLFHLDTNARREIVTYIRGVGLEVSLLRPMIRGGPGAWTRRRKSVGDTFGDIEERTGCTLIVRSHGAGQVSESSGE